MSDTFETIPSLELACTTGGANPPGGVVDKGANMTFGIKPVSRDGIMVHPAMYPPSNPHVAPGFDWQAVQFDKHGPVGIPVRH